MKNKIRVAITQGDTNGIGLEVILKALEDNRILELCTPVVFASAKAVSFYRKALQTQIQFTHINDVKQLRDGAVNVVNVGADNLAIEPGEGTAAAGRAAFDALEAATAALAAGDVDVLVTAPINKHNIQGEDFRFAGHTEYLEHKFAPAETSADTVIEAQIEGVTADNGTEIVGETVAAETVVAETATTEAAEAAAAPTAPEAADGKSKRRGRSRERLPERLPVPVKALMILFNDRMRVALTTTHLPLADVAAAITTDSVLEKIVLLDASLRRDFAIYNPRIAVLALNPHAGDDGLLGTEERDIIAPAIAKARESRIMAFGPYAADGFFGTAAYTHFDAVLAMYHDQGLAPFKALSMDDGVNFTAGLPYVRTSPDHGTAYDIAGKGEADPQSMLHAIYAAIDVFRARANDAEAHRNPLRRQYYDKGSDNVVLDLTKDE